MSDVGRNPGQWDEGCQQDEVRNSVVIPDLVRRIRRIRPRKIADIGCGTGYISLKASAQIQSSRASWTLLERDPSMRAYAAEKALGHVNIHVSDFDILDPSPRWNGAFDLCFVCFSTLDFGISRHVATNMHRIIAKGGTLIVYIPDFVEEVEQMCTIKGGLEPLSYYRKSLLHVKKADRFTKKHEVFIAQRPEYYVSYICSTGLFLNSLCFLDRDRERRIISMEFRAPNENC